jgi:CRP/FNR family transcriptional regulator
VVGQLRSVESVAHFIVEMDERLSRGSHSGLIELHLTREEIGSYLGLTLETVSRAFSKLKQMRVIAVAADAVFVLDRKRLSELASEVL